MVVYDGHKFLTEEETRSKLHRDHDKDWRKYHEIRHQLDAANMKAAREDYLHISQCCILLQIASLAAPQQHRCQSLHMHVRSTALIR